MKVYETSLQQTGAAESTRARQTEAASGGSGKAGGSSRAYESDQVQISSLSGRLFQALEAASGERTERIGRLAAEFRAGTLQVDPQALSRAVITDALGNER